MNIRGTIGLCAALLGLSATDRCAPPARAEGEAAEPAGGAFPAVEWVEGPAKGELGSHATVDVPKGYRFTGPAGTKKLMEAMQNPVSGSEVGFLASDSADWFIVFDFRDVGYVKDDEKDKLDADAILASIKEGNEAANEARREQGWSTLEILGWETPPKYDAVTHNLEWAVRGRDSGGSLVVNYNTRILGRGGVMEAALVCDPAALAATLPEFKGLLGGYAFNAGQTYAEYREGDKIAEYGLTALVTGGAVAVAAKSGLLAKLGQGMWKILVIAAVAIGGIAKKLLGKKE